MSDFADRLAIDLRNAYEAHDRTLFDQHLERMKRALRYTGPVPSTQRAIPVPHCLRFNGCVCMTAVEVALCMHRRPAPDMEPSALPRPHGTVDGDVCLSCGWTCNACVCGRYGPPMEGEVVRPR